MALTNQHGVGEQDQLLECVPADVLAASWLPTYEKYISVIQDELVRLNGNIYLFEKISAFPWAVFDSHRPTEHFWFMTWLALFEASVLGLWRLAGDTDARGMTMGHLKNEIARHVVPVRRREFRSLVMSSGFGAEIAHVKEKVKRLRHDHIAHLDLGERLKSRRGYVDPALLPLADLQRYRDTLNKLFAVLCFGHARMEYPLGYYPGRRPGAFDDPRTDIEGLLDAVADSSAVMKHYRDGGLNWDMTRKILGEERTQIVIDYAARLKVFEKWRIG